jgi:hypothetical protein
MPTLARSTTSLWRTAGLVAVFVTLGVSAIAQPPTRTSYAQTTPPKPAVTLSTRPSPPATGNTTFTVTVKAPDGKPVTGADVTIELVMPAMPAMNMPEMRSKVALRPAEDAKLAAVGTYTGAGQIMMAGTWNVTVSVKVGGKDYAETKTMIAAK